MELESKEAAKWLDNNWDKALFGGNAGLHVAEDDTCVGIIKNVVDFDNLPIPELEKQVRKDVEVKADTKSECFKRRDRSGNDEFTGTIKVIFKDRASLLSAVKDKVSIDHRRYQ